MKHGLWMVGALLGAVSASAATFDRDVPAAVQKQMVEDMTFVATVQGSAATPLHQQIFGSVDGAGYSKFFDERVKAIGLDACGGGNAVACVIPMRGSSKMWITQNYIKFSHPQIARLMIVFHEARHTEVKNRNWMHATCPRPFLIDGQPVRSIWTGAELAGEAACDVTPLGSYGSSTILLKNISKFCTNCSEKVKQDANLYAMDQLKRVIDARAKNDMIRDFAFGQTRDERLRGRRF